MIDVFFMATDCSMSPILPFKRALKWENGLFSMPRMNTMNTHFLILCNFIDPLKEGVVWTDYKKIFFSVVAYLNHQNCKHVLLILPQRKSVICRKKNFCHKCILGTIIGRLSIVSQLNTIGKNNNNNKIKMQNS